MQTQRHTFLEKRKTDCVVLRIISHSILEWKRNLHIVIIFWVRKMCPRIFKWLVQGSYPHQKTFYWVSALWNGEGNGTPLQYSCLENPMDGGAWWAAVDGVAKSQTWLSEFTFTFHFHALEKEMATTPVFLPGESQGRGSLVGCHLRGLTESDTTEAT